MLFIFISKTVFQKCLWFENNCSLSIFFFYVPEFLKQTLRLLTYISNEIKFLVASQTEILKKLEDFEMGTYNKPHHSDDSILDEMAECPIPIDNMLDLNVFEEKIAGDSIFRNKMVVFKLR